MKKFCDLYNPETLIYNTIDKLPNDYSRASSNGLITDPELHKYFEIGGVLRECCESFALDKLAGNGPSGRAAVMRQPRLQTQSTTIGSSAGA